MEYIRVPAAGKKLKLAEQEFRPVYMSAAAGCGKTAAARYVSRRRPALWLSARSGGLPERPPLSSIRRSLVIVDDLQWLREEDSRDYVRALLHTPGIQTFLLSRGAVPVWLVGEEMELDFVHISEQDLRLTGECVRQFFAQKGLKPEEADLALVEEAAQGYPYALLKYAGYMEHGEHFSEAMRQAVWEDVYRLWDATVFAEWENFYRDTVLAVCPYEVFSEEMMRLLTGSSHTREIIEYCRTMTHQLSVNMDGSYALRPEIRRFLLWKRQADWPEEKQRENYRRAALYYEINGNAPEALRYYEMAGDMEQMRLLLIRNAELHPGAGHYFETREYYSRLPPEEIRKSPVLMSGISLLYSLVLQPEQSEAWYAELAAYEKNPVYPERERKEARSRLVYLDIALPHRGIRGLASIMKRAFSLMTRGELRLPEMSVTGNMPSLMNGGLDFCEWSRKDTQLARVIGNPVEAILGRFGRGLVAIALAESGFEKGTMSAAEVYRRLGGGWEAAAHGGKTEMCFAAAGVLVRQHLAEGQAAAAKKTAKLIRELAEEKGADQLFPNLEAFDTWLSLYEGDADAGKKYLEQTGDIRKSFCILERYRIMIRLRCLIAENRLAEALELSGFIDGYVIPYERHFLRMENHLLRAMAQYRMGDTQWMQTMKEALKLAEEYHFVRVISLEGAAVLPLLRELPPEERAGEYREQIVQEAERTALAFPDYMSALPRREVRLTERETQVLSMLCAGLSMERICEVCGITYSGLKKHNRSIYRKLGAANRAEAERRAMQLGLVHRRGSGAE